MKNFIKKYWYIILIILIVLIVFVRVIQIKNSACWSSCGDCWTLSRCNKDDVDAHKKCTQECIEKYWLLYLFK